MEIFVPLRLLKLELIHAKHAIEIAVVLTGATSAALRLAQRKMRAAEGHQRAEAQRRETCEHA